MSFGPLSPKPKPIPLRTTCDCIRRISDQDIYDILLGHVMKCRNCGSIIWHDPLFWPDIGFSRILWSNKENVGMAKLSIWSIQYIYDKYLRQPRSQVDSQPTDVSRPSYGETGSQRT